MDFALNTGRAARGLERVARSIRRGFNRLRGVPGHTRVDLCWRLGDEVMALPIYEALHRQQPEALLTVACNYPDLLIDNPFARLTAREDQRPDRLIDLRSGPRDVYRLQHYARLAGVPLPQARPGLYYQNWQTPLLDPIPGPFVALAPGASWPTKRWAVENWRAVADEIGSLGLTVVELGVEGEQLGVGLSLAGRTSVREAACVLHAARLVVTCDSGLMHLALAAGARVVALFGPTDPDILVRDAPGFYCMKSAASCRGCWNHGATQPVPGTCREFESARCMDLIDPKVVAGKVRGLLTDLL